MGNTHISCMPEGTEEDKFFGWDGPGWYFFDESEAYMHGPFSSFEDARKSFECYVGQLNATSKEEI